MSVIQLNKQFALGIDIGGTNTKYGLVNQRGEVLMKGRIKTKDYPKIEDFIDLLSNLLVCGEQGIIRINPGRTFVEISGTNEGIAFNLIPFQAFYRAGFTVNLQSRYAKN